MPLNPLASPNEQRIIHMDSLVNERTQTYQQYDSNQDEGIS